MQMQTYLIKRQNVYHFRRRIPKNLIATLGKNEVVRSLGTTDFKTATRAAMVMADELEQLFRRIQTDTDLLTQRGEELVYGHILKKHTLGLKKEALEEFDNRQPEAAELEAFHSRFLRQEVLNDLKLSRLDSVRGDVDKLLQEFQVTIKSSSAAYKQLSRTILRALADSYVNAELIVKGDFENPRLYFDDNKLTEDKSSGNESLLTFGSVMSKYINDKRGGWSEKRYEAQVSKLNYFLAYAQEIDELSGEIRTLDSTSSSDARNYKEHLQGVPKNATKLFPDHSPRETVRKAQEQDLNILSLTTQNNYLQVLSSLYSFATKELDYEGKNPFEGRAETKAAGKLQRDQRDPFSQKQLETLFSSPLYTGCKTLPSCHLPGSLIPNNSHKYWTPLIALLTGMRMQEILQLHLEDIYQKEGIWVLDLNTNHHDKRLKSPQSKRLVPLHKKLVELGFLKFVEDKRAASNSPRLFDDAKLANDNTYSSTFSKWFSRHLEKLGIKTDKTSFHSLRHNLKDSFREAGESDELAENFMGRSTGSTGEAYGSGFSIKKQHQAINKIKFNQIIIRDS
jgi:integrase